jgi:hypothetical protein
MVSEAELRNKLLLGAPTLNRSLIQGWEATEAGSFPTSPETQRPRQQLG